MIPWERTLVAPSADWEDQRAVVNRSDRARPYLSFAFTYPPTRVVKDLVLDSYALRAMLSHTLDAGMPQQLLFHMAARLPVAARGCV